MPPPDDFDGAGGAAGEPLMRALTEPMAQPARAARTPLSLKFLLYMLRGVQVGSLDVVLPDGRASHFRGREPGPHGVMRLNDATLPRHVLRNGEVGVGEAYMDGGFDSPDLASLLAVLYLNEPHYRGPYERNPIGRAFGWLQHRLRDNTRAGARRNIEHHYDLGNDFYAAWLDPSMAYSSGLYASPADTLAQAQQNKYARMAQRLQLQPSHHLLEIGSGWGGFAIHCAQQHGCRVTSITLSREQLEEARRRAHAAGVADRVQFELVDYRDLAGQFDRVVSIEMYEAVGERWWRDWFGTIARVLVPGGLAAIQGITIAPGIFEHYRTKRDFIQKYIFPGGMLCPPERFQQLAREAGLAPSDVQLHASDYARTLADWHHNVLDAREVIRAQFGERFLRMWRYYLAYCECGFRVGSIDLMQVTLRRE